MHACMQPLVPGAAAVVKVFARFERSAGWNRIFATFEPSQPPLSELASWGYYGYERERRNRADYLLHPHKTEGEVHTSAG